MPPSVKPAIEDIEAGSSDSSVLLMRGLSIADENCDKNRIQEVAKFLTGSSTDIPLKMRLGHESVVTFKIDHFTK